MNLFLAAFQSVLETTIFDQSWILKNNIFDTQALTCPCPKILDQIAHLNNLQCFFHRQQEAGKVQDVNAVW